MTSEIRVGRSGAFDRVQARVPNAIPVLLTLVGATTLGFLAPHIQSPEIIVVAFGLGEGALLFAVMRGPAALITGIFVLALVSLPWNAVRVTDWLTLSDGLLVSGAIALLVSGRRPAAHALRQIRPIVAGVFVVVAAGLIGSYAATDVATGLANMARFSVAVLALPLIMAWWYPDARTIRIVVGAWAIGASVSALAAILQLQGGDVTRVPGLATHSNALAITSLMAAGPAMCYVSATRLTVRLLAIGVVTLLLVAVIISGSRAGLLGYIGVVAVFAVLSRRPALALVGIGALLGGILIGLMTVSTDNALSRLLTDDLGSASASNAGRLVLLEDNLRLSLQYPLFGIGFEAGGEAHNIFLQVVVSGGIVGLGGFLYLLYGVMSSAFRSITSPHERRDPEIRLLRIGLLASFAGYLVAGLFQNALWDRYIWAVPGLLAVAIATTSEPTHVSRQEAPVSSRRSGPHQSEGPRGPAE